MNKKRSLPWGSVEGRVLMRPVNNHSILKNLPAYCYRITAETTNTYIALPLLVTVPSVFAYIKFLTTLWGRYYYYSHFSNAGIKAQEIKMPNVTEVEYNFLPQVNSSKKHWLFLVSILCLVDILSSYLCDPRICERKLLSMMSLILHLFI